MKTVVKLVPKAIALEEHGQMLSTPTTDMWRRTTTPILAATMTMAIEILTTDHKRTVSAKLAAEKLVMPTSSLLCKTTAGAHAITPTDHQLEPTIKEMTMTAGTLKEFLLVEVGLMLCIATTYTSQEISRLLMTSNTTWSMKNPISS
jgi:hypothetical protein